MSSPPHGSSWGFRGSPQCAFIPGVSFVLLSACGNISSSSEHSLCPLLHLACLQWVSVSFLTSVPCSNPLPSTFVPSSLLVCLWPPQHPSISVTTFPAGVLEFHHYPWVLQQALFSSYTETTLPPAFVVPQITLDFPSAMSDASIPSPVLKDFQSWVSLGLLY